MKMKNYFYNLILAFFICLLSFSSIAANLYVIEGTYEYEGTSYNIDFNGNARTASNDSPGEDDNDDEDDFSDDGSDDDSDNDIDDNEDDENYSDDDEDEDDDSGRKLKRGEKDSNIITNDEFTMDEAQIIVPFSDPQMEFIGGDDYQLDLFGICMAGDIGYYTGNKQYLGNTELLSDFYQWLDKAHYDSSSLAVLIERLKEILGVITGTLEGKEYFTYDTDALNSIQARKVMTTTLKFKQTMELIFFGLGVIFVIYGFVLVLSWLFDRSLLPLMSETGLLEKGMLGLVTFGNLRADEVDIDKHSVTFIKILIFGFACIVIGRVIISQAFRDALTNFVVSCLNKINGV